MNWLNNELLALQRELAKKNSELEKLNQTVQVLSVTDPLTKINNRRGFFEKRSARLVRQNVIATSFVGDG